jgi:diaminopimelate epimerase
MGRPRAGTDTLVSANDRTWEALEVDMGNPHAVAFVDDLAHAGPLRTPPAYDRSRFPDGVNVEFVLRVRRGHVAMRVHERGSGETRSCGTGACAVMVASALADGAGPGSAYDVDLPGGRLRVAWTDDDRVLMTGPAVIVAEGYWLVGR